MAHTRLDESRPHVTWEIRAGGEDGDAHFVCGSADPIRSCVLDASTEKKQNETTIHLYLHAVGQPTSYLGLMRAGFLSGFQPNGQTEVNTTVPVGSQSGTVSINGAVTDRPGPYALTIALSAIQPGMASAQTIAPEVNVTVR